MFWVQKSKLAFTAWAIDMLVLKDLHKLAIPRFQVFYRNTNDDLIYALFQALIAPRCHNSSYQWFVCKRGKRHNGAAPKIANTLLI